MAEARNEHRTSPVRGRTDTAQQMPAHRESARQQPERGLTPQRELGAIGRYRDPFSLMDRLFENLGFGSLMPFFGRDVDRGLWAPQIELQERDGKLIVRADLPGMSKDDVHCEIRNDMLILEGERKREQHDEQGGWSERSYGRFLRSIPLPDGVNGDSAKASFDNGVLQITLDVPKHEEKGGKKIEIS